MANPNRLRLGLELDSGFRPLLGIQVSRDGGLVLDLSRYAPLEEFRYGVVDIPTASGSYTVLPRETESAWAQGVSPKIHYHRSGELSVDATGRLERYKVKGAPLAEIRSHAHTLIFMVREPEKWAAAPQRSADAAFRVEGALETMTVNGYVGDLAALNEPYASDPLSTVGLDVEHDDGTIVPTLILKLGDGDLRYYLWLSLLANQGFRGGSGPAVLLHAFDPLSARDVTTPTETVAAWAVSDP